jgi:hypothetical protein
MQLRINAAGIPEYQYKLALNDRDMLYIRKTKEGRNVNSGPHAFTLQQISIIFMIHGVFLGCAVVIFCFEVLIGKIFRVKRRIKRVGHRERLYFMK